MMPTVIGETNEYLVINKPAGLVTHPSGKTKEYSVSQWFSEHYPDSVEVGEPLVTTIGGEIIEIPRPGIVHRLDKDTSGVMVIAKTPEMFDFLKSQFGERKVKKTYLALVHGTMKQERGTISEPIGRERGGVERMSTGSRIRGASRPAETTYMVTNTGEFEGQKFSLLQCIPKTGRTHQIRVHLAYVKHPIISDILYGHKNGLEQDKLLIERMALHAWRLSFTDNLGKEVSFNAPLPEDMKKVLGALDIRSSSW